MRPDITEFSFGYALTSNLMDRFALQEAGAPIFPNQQQEGASGGYDVMLPSIVVFLQFKLSECMVRTSAQGSAQLGVPHFRFHLRPLKHSQQHNLLRELEAAGNEVYYAAPGFHLPSELNDAFSNGQAADRSAFFLRRISENSQTKTSTSSLSNWVRILLGCFQKRRKSLTGQSLRCLDQTRTGEAAPWCGEEREMRCYALSVTNCLTFLNSRLRLA